MSPLVIDALQKPKKTQKLASRILQTPEKTQYEPFNPAKRDIFTPKTSKDLTSTLQTLDSQLTNNPVSRLLFRKIKKSFDIKNFDMALQKEKISSLEVTMEGLKKKKKKKVKSISFNSKFSGIEEVMKAKWAVQNNPDLEIIVRT